MSDTTWDPQLTEDQMKWIIGKIAWEGRIDSQLGDLMVASARKQPQSLYTIEDLVKKLEKRDRLLIAQTEIYIYDQAQKKLREEIERQDAEKVA